MSITRNDPNAIFLGGNRVQVNDVACSEAITPGMLLERFNNGGVTRWRKHATAGGNTVRAVATDQAMVNKGVDDAYAANDLVEASILEPGATAWMLIPSGETITYGQQLESEGTGLLRAKASGTALFTALENKTATATTRIRVEAI